MQTRDIVGVGINQGNQNEEAFGELCFWQRWGCEKAEQWVEDAYNEVMTFYPDNIFEPPKCNVTKGFMEENASLIRAYTCSTSTSSFSFKTLGIISNLIWRKTHKRSRSDDMKAIKRKKEQWKQGDVSKLLDKANTSQKRMRRGKSRMGSTEDRLTDSPDKMKLGKVPMATESVIVEEDSSGVLL